MKVYKEKDGERISSPLVVGFGGLDEAESCTHEYVQLGDGSPVEEHPELTLYLEQCTKCRLANRTRVEGPEELLAEHFPDGSAF